MGFDGVEILHVQMLDESNAALRKIKKQSHSLGLALMGFSTHQGFVNPDVDLRRTNVQKTLYLIDLASRLVLPRCGSTQVGGGRQVVRRFHEAEGDRAPRSTERGQPIRRPSPFRWPEGSILLLQLEHVDLTFLGGELSRTSGDTGDGDANVQIITFELVNA